MRKARGSRRTLPKLKEPLAVYTSFAWRFPITLAHGKQVIIHPSFPFFCLPAPYQAVPIIPLPGISPPGFASGHGKERFHISTEKALLSEPVSHRSSYVYIYLL